MMSRLRTTEFLTGVLVDVQLGRMPAALKKIQSLKKNDAIVAAAFIMTWLQNDPRHDDFLVFLRSNCG